MWGIVVSALGFIFRYAFGAGAIKWVLLALLTYGFSMLVDMLLSFFPSWFSADGMNGAFSTFGPWAWYFFDYSKSGDGLSIVLGAYTARFLIRRIPFIG